MARHSTPTLAAVAIAAMGGGVLLQDVSMPRDALCSRLCAGYERGYPLPGEAGWCLDGREVEVVSVVGSHPQFDLSVRLRGEVERLRWAEWRERGGGRCG